jgi:hypothetical protein
LEVNERGYCRARVVERNNIMNMSNLLKSIRYPVGALVLVALLSPHLTAQNDELPQLQQKIVDLERRMERLEGLLKEYNEFQKEQMRHLYGWQNKKNWRRLKIGMPQNQVKGLLGEPTKVIKGVRTLWYYPNVYSGYVSFDQNGNLTGWNEP